MDQRHIPFGKFGLDLLELNRPQSAKSINRWRRIADKRERLAALVPQPRIHLTRFFGCLAPHAKIRSQIVPKKPEATDPAPSRPEPTSSVPKRSRRMRWAELLARVFAIDLKNCPHCPGELKIVAAIVETGAIRKILGHLGLPDLPPPIAPARLAPQMSFD